MTLGELIYKYRKEKGISQRKFAELCGNSITHAYICMLEKNRNPNTGKPLAPRMDVYKSIAGAMRISLDELLDMLDDSSLVSFDPPDERSELVQEIIDLASTLPPEKLALAQAMLKAIAENA